MELVQSEEITKSKSCNCTFEIPSQSMIIQRSYFDDRCSRYRRKLKHMRFDDLVRNVAVSFLRDFFTHDMKSHRLNQVYEACALFITLYHLGMRTEHDVSRIASLFGVRCNEVERVYYEYMCFGSVQSMIIQEYGIIDPNFLDEFVRLFKIKMIRDVLCRGKNNLLGALTYKLVYRDKTTASTIFGVSEEEITEIERKMVNCMIRSCYIKHIRQTVLADGIGISQTTY